MQAGLLLNALRINHMFGKKYDPRFVISTFLLYKNKKDALD